MGSNIFFGDVYRNRKVLIFGNTGFKGSWLTVWLDTLGARIVGASNGVPTTPSHYERASLGDTIEFHQVDIGDRSAVIELIDEVKPEFVFHLAAQALVRRSYAEPVDTILTNSIGTLNVLEGLRRLESPCTAIFITSDKCYENVEQFYGYREVDRLGGKDPYSASKAAAEIIIHSYYHSYFKPSDTAVRIASVRAGNVIGGGDWAEDRIIPDIVRAWRSKEPIEIRSPAATRPWQLVLEPLSGYLLLGAAMSDRPELSGESYNFGPRGEDVYPVIDIVQSLAGKFGDLQIVLLERQDKAYLPYEASLLKLSCDKALHELGWTPTLSFAETIDMTADWYRDFYGKSKNAVLKLSQAQIEQYQEHATERNLVWTS